MTEFEDWPDPSETRTRKTGRWRGVAGVALLFGVASVLLRTPAMLLVGAIGVALAGYPRLARPPAPQVTLSRTVEDRDVELGDPIRVTVTVANDGGSWLTDLRVVDGVPASTVVTDGSPACRTALGPGETTMLTYDVETDRGAAGFRPALVATRDPAGVVEHASRIEADGDGAVECAPAFEPVDDVPLRAQTARDAGRQTIEESGDGVAFQVLREHQHGDPRSRIAWRHLARTGELATVDFQPERAATVVLVLDTRPAARLAPGNSDSTAVQRSVDAAARLFATLDDDGHRVGIATLDDRRRWLTPGRGRTHRARARELLTDDALLAGRAGAFDPDGVAEWLRDRAPAAAQVIVLTPACDDGIASFLARLDALDVPTSVCSPDPTATDTPGQQLAGLERERRLTQLRRAGVPVFEWDDDDSLDRAFLERRADE